MAKRTAYKKRVYYAGNVIKGGTGVEIILTPKEVEKAHSRWKEDYPKRKKGKGKYYIVI